MTAPHTLTTTDLTFPKYVLYTIHQQRKIRIFGIYQVGFDKVFWWREWVRERSTLKLYIYFRLFVNESGEYAIET